MKAECVSGDVFTSEKKKDSINHSPNRKISWLLGLQLKQPAMPSLCALGVIGNIQHCQCRVMGSTPIGRSSGVNSMVEEKCSTLLVRVRVPNPIPNNN